MANITTTSTDFLEERERLRLLLPENNDEIQIFRNYINDILKSNDIHSEEKEYFKKHMFRIQLVIALYLQKQQKQNPNSLSLDHHNRPKNIALYLNRQYNPLSYHVLEQYKQGTSDYNKIISNIRELYLTVNSNNIPDGPGVEMKSINKRGGKTHKKRISKRKGKITRRRRNKTTRRRTKTNKRCKNTKKKYK